MTDAVRYLLELQNTSGMNAKKEIVAAHKDDADFRRLLYYALHPLLTYKISEQTLRRPAPISGPNEEVFEDFFDVCNALSVRKALDDRTVYRVKQFLDACDSDEREVFIKILSKTLRLGITARSVNKVIPGLLPEWEVQQAFPIEKYPLKHGVWFCLTQKLNGIRATYHGGVLYGRSGEILGGLDHITAEISRRLGDKYVLDGELTLLNTDGICENEAFRIATGIVNSDAPSKTKICFTVFDIVPTDEFNTGRSKDTYSTRRMFLNYLSGTIFHCCEYVKILEPLYCGIDQSMIGKMLDKMVSEDKEGCMVNLDVPYKCKRHNGVLKVKRFYTMDLPIIKCEEGSGRLDGTLGAFVLDYKGNEVRVGSGLTEEERNRFWRMRDELPGILCEVKYKEISSDKKTGAESLQFPVFVGLRTDKTEVSFG